MMYVFAGGALPEGLGRVLARESSEHTLDAEDVRASSWDVAEGML